MTLSLEDSAIKSVWQQILRTLSVTKDFLKDSSSEVMGIAGYLNSP